MVNFWIDLGTLPLYTWRWTSDHSATPRAVIQIVHSLSEHMGRYEEFASFLTDYGYEVWGHDHPGHGQTGPEPGKCPGDAMSLLLGGVSAVREAIAREHPDVPVYLFGHGLGSFLALRSAQLDKSHWDGLILSGTSDRLPPILERAAMASNTMLARVKKRRLAEAAVNLLMTRGIGTLGIHRFDWRTRDTREARRYYEDPHCGIPTDHEFMNSLTRGLSVWYRKEELARLSRALPVLIISGTEDRVGNNGKGAAKLAKSLTSAGLPLVYLRFYEGARHDLLWEFSRQETMVDILEFLRISAKEFN